MSKHGDSASGPGWWIYCGDYREAFEALDESCPVGAVITDPPYGSRTHRGNDDVGNGRDNAERRALSYSHWSPSDVRDFADFWHARIDGWIAAMSCSDLSRAWRDHLEAAGRCGFAPLPCVIRGMTVRMQGDGPSSWSVSLNVARPRREPFLKWGTLPGEYRDTPDRLGHIGGKPLGMMRAIVRDYSRPGDVVIDPCAGGGTTLLAAVVEGREALGAEVDPETFDKAVARLRKGYTPSFGF